MELRDQLKHLYNRAGFGAVPADLQQYSDIKTATDALLKVPVPQPLEVVSQEEHIAQGNKAMKTAMLTEDEMKLKKKSFREKTSELGLLWFQQMVTTEHPLQEKMALFWHGHFATRIDNPYFDQLLLQDLRAHALGNFTTLLTAVSKSPAMLQFLNNQQNRKQHPNENFAREVMELFTLGRGHYTESDIKEAARAFTGWGYDEDGAFTFRKKQHDEGNKTILGQTGTFNGDDVLQILLAQKQTALFITQKIYRYFVNEESVDAKRVQALATDFKASGYNIAQLLQQIFTAKWFSDKRNIAARIKSPIDLLVGLQRTIPMEYEEGKTLVRLQRVLGQQLFYPPNVAGWPGGKTWIDSSSLVLRMRLPEAFFADKSLDLQAKEQDAEMTEINKKTRTQDSQKDGRFKVGKVAADWSGWIEYWKQTGEDNLPSRMAGYLLPVPLNRQQMATIARFADRKHTDNYIKSVTILLMSLPEYQLS
jgi:uncharacterized protein (DUF1800 family)